MKKIILLFVSINTFVFGQTISQSNLQKHLNYLASDKLNGRGTSSPDEKVAAEYIANEFKKIGLKPGNNTSYLYDFVFKQGASVHDTSTANSKERKGMDVIGYLNNDAPYTIVIGAHFDHLGLGHDHNSKDANPENKIHNGADDNASGTVGVIELANYFMNNNKKEKYNFLFMCFSGEELGLIGSKKWCDKPTLPLNTINYMINLDMVGRLNDSTKKLLVYGVGTSPTWVPLLDSMKTIFSIKKDSAGIGPSDQTSFYLKDIPVLHFFTGQHNDYHKPSDDADKINYKGEVEVLNYIIRLVNILDNSPKLTFLKTRNAESTKGGYKVTMGIMPDYAFEGKGVKADGVSDGKPAAKAGVMKNDIIIKLGDSDINTIQEYMKALGKFNKGETTKVKVLREGKEVELSVTF